MAKDNWEFVADRAKDIVSSFEDVWKLADSQYDKCHAVFRRHIRGDENKYRLTFDIRVLIEEDEVKTEQSYMLCSKKDESCDGESSGERDDEDVSSDTGWEVVSEYLKNSYVEDIKGSAVENVRYSIRDVERDIKYANLRWDRISGEELPSEQLADNFPEIGE
jgi:hypothetical protein